MRPVYFYNISGLMLLNIFKKIYFKSPNIARVIKKLCVQLPDFKCLMSNILLYLFVYVFFNLLALTNW